MAGQQYFFGHMAACGVDLDGCGVEVCISKAELERNGDLERLLNGEKVNVISLNLILFGIEIVMDAPSK